MLRPSLPCASPDVSLPQSYSEQLGGDPIVHAHLSALYDTLLEQNLIRWVHCFNLEHPLACKCSTVVECGC